MTAFGSASAPASSGNLGAGFDTLALALDLRCTVEARQAATTAILDAGGNRRVVPAGEVVARAVAAVGPPMELIIRSDIPRSRGLGSSAAVAAATVAACLRVQGEPAERGRVFELGDELEGHGDNAAAAVFGGLQAAMGTTCRRLTLHEDLVPLVAVPDFELRTDDARAALPDAVPLPLAARSVARAVFLVEGLRTGDVEALRVARGDELHEGPRAGLSPLTTGLVAAALDAGAVHAAWSGAGPAALALATEDRLDAVSDAFLRVLGPVGEVRRLHVDEAGLS